MTQQDSVIFLVDSSKRISGTTSDFTYQLNLPKGHEFDNVCVLQCIIPKSYYLVQPGYNTFVLKENGVSTTITVTPGNYNAKSWSTIIGTLLTTSSSQGWTYTITFPNSTTSVDTGLFTYSCVGGNPSFIFTTNLYEQFGFQPNSTNTFSSNTLVSANVVKFQVEDVLYLHSDISYNPDQSSTNDVLQEIYASTTPNYTNIVYQNSGAVEGYSKQLLNQSNNIYHFVLTDENNNTLSLNGLNMVITLLIWKRQTFWDMAKKFMSLMFLKNQQ